VDNLAATQGATGVYRGPAQCVVQEPGARAATELSGSSLFNVLFDSRYVAGRMTFPALTLDASATVSGNGIRGQITNMTYQGTSESALSSSLRGTFFGPNAEALGGGFRAGPLSRSPAPTVHGTFEAARQ
jgi:hypothetical protein